MACIVFANATCLLQETGINVSSLPQFRRNELRYGYIGFGFNLDNNRKLPRELVETEKICGPENQSQLIIVKVSGAPNGLFR